jgi:hypothetical protein
MEGMFCFVTTIWYKIYTKGSLAFSFFDSWDRCSSGPIGSLSETDINIRIIVDGANHRLAISLESPEDCKIEVFQKVFKAPPSM